MHLLKGLIEDSETHPFSPFLTDLTTSLTPLFKCLDLEAINED